MLGEHLPSGLQQLLLGLLLITKSLQLDLDLMLPNHQLIESPNRLQVSGQSRIGLLGSPKSLIGHLLRSSLLSKHLVCCLQLDSLGYIDMKNKISKNISCMKN
jgi:hypothetical protein